MSVPRPERSEQRSGATVAWGESSFAVHDERPVDRHDHRVKVQLDEFGYLFGDAGHQLHE
jgi:hypothetical protein